MRHCTYYALILLVLFPSCSPGEVEAGLPPLFKSSVPANEAVDVPTATTIEITFDEVVTLQANHGITINNQPAGARVLLTRLTLNTTLEAGTRYTVIIPPGAVINTRGIPSGQEIVLSFTTRANPVFKARDSLVTKNPSPGAQRLFHYLKGIYGRHTLSGTMANVCWNINEARWVFHHTGQYPAINGFDLIHLHFSPANWINYHDISVVREWWESGGIVHLMWHWNVPVSAGSQNRAFYTTETTFDVSRAVIPGTWENSVIMADLAEAAEILILLRDANIPVLWRPLHEAAGTWFWWGARGPEPCKALWRLMFDYFKARGINNLVWVWTVETNDEDWFPGTDVVDIIGRDLYNRPQANWSAEHYNWISQTYPGMMVSLSECGNVADIYAQWNAGARWLFFMPWYDYHRTVNINAAAFWSQDHLFANAAWWRATLNHAAVLTRDEVPNLR